MHCLRDSLTRSLAGLVAVGLALGAAAGEPEPPAIAPVADGYIADQACASCHADLSQSYTEVGMARSFSKPSAAGAIEDFDRPFTHAASGRTYTMKRQGDEYIFARHQVDIDGEPVFEIELPVAWILGSGHTSRTYLFSAPSGELFQLPVAWYSQGQRWGMAPGYDSEDHLGLARRVRRECMFCHNAYPQAPVGSDAYGAPPVFPDELPQGTGCQRCHGPGAEHVERAASGTNLIVVRNTIVNPGRLAPDRARDVCYQCHLQPSVSLFGPRRFNRGDYSFRPGEALADYRVLIDVDEEGREREERFEINHHPYRLEQSACFKRSGDALSCLSCHNPHRKVPVAERAAHYRRACQSCHAKFDCSRPERAAAPHEADEAADCVSCHMPRRRTQDVVHITMTDHFIRRRPSTEDLLAPLAEGTPVLVGIGLTEGDAAPHGALGEIYKAAAVARLENGVSTAAVNRLGQLLEAFQVPEDAPYLDLAQGQLTQGRWEQALTTLDTVQSRYSGPRHSSLATIKSWAAIAQSKLGRTARSIELAREAIEFDQRVPEAHLNLGLFLRDALEPEQAIGAIERAIELRPTFAAAWYQLARTRLALGQLAAARQALISTLRVDPAHTEAYVALVRTARWEGDVEAARCYARHGSLHARNPEALAELTP